MKVNRRHTIARTLWLGAALGAAWACSPAPAATFDTPHAAMMCVADVIGTGADNIDARVGKGAYEMLDSGDALADEEDAQAIQREIHEGVAFEDLGTDKKVALLGEEQWAFPIPLVCENGRWRFEIGSAKDELLNRRIGGNELMTIATLREYVDAQREYFAEEHDGTPHAYARWLISSQGTHDGLYWPAAEGEPESPFGPMLTNAACEDAECDPGQGMPLHGYYLRTLRAQGPHAPGGARSYIDDKGLMTGGFALLAWPKDADSGVMTFQVNQCGIVFQKNLGSDTAKMAAEIRSYDPDDTWSATAD